MTRIPFSTPAMAAITAAFLLGFCWHMEHGDLIYSLIAVTGSTWCLFDLGHRLVEHFRKKRINR